MKRWGGEIVGRIYSHGQIVYQIYIDYAQDHADLGAALNAFSLNQSGAVAAALEKTGQAADATYISTTQMVCNISIV